MSPLSVIQGCARCNSAHLTLVHTSSHQLGELRTLLPNATSSNIALAPWWDIYPTETGRCYKSGNLFWRPGHYLPAHHRPLFASLPQLSAGLKTRRGRRSKRRRRRRGEEEDEEEEKENILPPPSEAVEHGSGLKGPRRMALNLIRVWHHKLGCTSLNKRKESESMKSAQDKATWRDLESDTLWNGEV